MKNMENKSFANRASNGLRWLGAELILVAGIVWAFRPTVTLFMVPFTGNKMTLSLFLLIAGVESLVAGVLWRRYITKN